MEGLLVLSVLLLALFSAYWADRKARAMITVWAGESGMRVLQLEQRWFRRGPFTWNSGKSQLVFHVTVLHEGARRSAFIRCGGWFLGMLSEQMDVRWTG
jgi:hypothetical protein